MSKSERAKASGVKRSGGSSAEPSAKRARNASPDSQCVSRTTGGGDADILLGSFVTADLPTNMGAVYTRVVRRLLPPAQQRFVSEAGIMEESDNATLTFEVADKATAEAMFRRLKNAKVFGRRWKVQYHPLSATQASREASLVDARLVPPGPRALVLRALRGIQGFLTLIDDPHGSKITHNNNNNNNAHANGGGNVGNGSPADETANSSSVSEDSNAADDAADVPFTTSERSVSHVVASFVDEGSALHARAVLSGRLIGTSGVRLFLERHR